MFTRQEQIFVLFFVFVFLFPIFHSVYNALHSTDHYPTLFTMHCTLQTIPMRGKFRVLCPCVRRKFVVWDVPAAMGSLLSTAYLVSPERR